MLRAVLFDYGLTLVTFEYPAAELAALMEEVRGELPQPAPSAQTLLREVLLPMERYVDAAALEEIDYMAAFAEQWRSAGFELSPDLLDSILDREQRVWDRAARPAEGAHATLAGLRARGLRTGLASNAPFPARYLHRQLEQVGLAPLLDAALFSSEVGRRKPAPDLYLAVLERLEVAPEQALFVGDRADWDYDAPRALGMRAVLCTAHARRPVPPGVPSIGRLDELLRDGFLPEAPGPHGAGQGG